MLGCAERAEIDLRGGRFLYRIKGDETQRIGDRETHLAALPVELRQDFVAGAYDGTHVGILGKERVGFESAAHLECVGVFVDLDVIYLIVGKLDTVFFKRGAVTEVGVIAGNARAVAAEQNDIPMTLSDEIIDRVIGCALIVAENGVAVCCGFLLVDKHDRHAGG